MGGFQADHGISIGIDQAYHGIASKALATELYIRHQVLVDTDADSQFDEPQESWSGLPKYRTTSNNCARTAFD